MKIRALIKYHIKSLFGYLFIVLVVISMPWIILVLMGFLQGVYPIGTEKSNSLGIYINSFNVSVTVLYVILTYLIVSQTKNSITKTVTIKKIEFTEKRLEKLYYPLKDCLNSHRLVPCSNKSMIPLGNYGDSSASRCTIEDIYPFQYLATKKLNGSLCEYIEMIRELKSLEMTGNQILDLHKEICNNVNNDIEDFIKELSELVKSS